jgi:hypothetical protein
LLTIFVKRFIQDIMTFPASNCLKKEGEIEFSKPLTVILRLKILKIILRAKKLSLHDNITLSPML